jgi:hypothetical protein
MLSPEERNKIQNQLENAATSNKLAKRLRKQLKEDEYARTYELFQPSPYNQSTFINNAINQL